jgi:hypothetical protein
MWGSTTAIRELTAELTNLINKSLDTNTSNVDAIVSAIKTNNCCHCDIVEAINASAKSRDYRLELLVASVNNIAAVLKRFFRPPNPGRLKLIMVAEIPRTGDTQMVDIIAFKVQLPDPPTEPNDIVNGQLTVQIGGADPQVIITAKDQIEVIGLSGEQDSTVNLAFVYIDDSGLISREPSTLVGTLIDTFPPPNPGVLGLIITGETTPAPAPPSEPVPPPSEPVPTPSEPVPTPSEWVPPEEPIV